MPTTMELVNRSVLLEKVESHFKDKPITRWLENEQAETRLAAEKLRARLDQPSKGDDERPTQSRQEYLDFTALHFSGTKPSVGPDASPEEKEADRHRRLCALSTKHRRVFSKWPRDPDGEVIEPGQTEGTGSMRRTGSKRGRFPDVRSVALYTTGSKLLAWMKKHGETYAEDQLALAEDQPEPREVHPWPIAEALKDTDRLSKRAKGFKAQGKTPAHRIEFGQTEPFSPIPAPFLQERAPFRLLPRRLIVHDPSRLLRADYSSSDLPNEPKGWDDKPDLVSVYRLELSKEGKAKLKQEEDAIEKQGAEDRKALANFLENPTTENMPPDQGILLYQGAQKEVGPCTPALFLVHAPAPVKRPVEEAHIYLSPHHLVGRGNHSYAFRVEWEVPRSMVVPDRLCDICVIEKGLEMVAEDDGVKGETRDARWNELSGEVVEVVDFSPGVDVSIITSSGDDILNEDGEEVVYEILPRRIEIKNEYRGPLRVIHTGIEYQNPQNGSLCGHLAEEEPASLTANVAVVAKLSHPYDDHLQHEAKTYQEFPMHFFQHFTGFNQLRPLRDPFPVGALVPQFYGYYVPEDGNKPMIFDKKVSGSGAPGEAGRAMWKETKLKYEYRSPIMLLEHCGRAIPSNVRDLSIDDRETCASLFLRMHHAGWIQGSPYTRNILMQSGPIDTYPLNRMANAMNERSDLRKTTFRLIDFGRSEKFAPQGRGRVEEEARVVQTFKLLHHQNDD